MCDHDSFWRVHDLDMHSKTRYVERLPCHLDSMNIVHCRRKENRPRLAKNALVQKTMLIEWFVANKKHLKVRSLTYRDFPTRWAWVAGKGAWVEKTRGDTIGRIYYVHSSSGEL